MPVDDIVVLLMADYGVNLYGNVIIVNPKFAAEKSGSGEGFPARFRERHEGHRRRSPDTAVDSVMKRNDVAKKPTELERLNMAMPRQHGDHRGEG